MILRRRQEEIDGATESRFGNGKEAGTRKKTFYKCLTTGRVNDVILEACQENRPHFSNGILPQPIHIMKSLILASTLLWLTSLTGCAKVEVVTPKPRAEVVNALQDYFAEKFPVFADLRNVGTGAALDAERMGELERLHERSPVSEIVNSFPHGPFLTFVERTRSPDGALSLLHVDLYAADDGSCRVVLETKKAKGEPRARFAEAKPITEEEIRRLLN